MVKRLMALFVASGMFFSGAKADENIQPNNIQEVISHTVSDTYFSVSCSFNESFVSMPDVSDEADQSSTIDLHVSNTVSHLKITINGDGNDIPELALDGIKMLIQAISPEDAAAFLIKTYKENNDELAKTMPTAMKEGIEKLETREDAVELFGKMMQLMMDTLREKTLDLAVMQAALPKDVWLECETAIIGSTQNEISAFYAALNATDCSMGEDSSTEEDDEQDSSDQDSSSQNLDKVAFAQALATFMQNCNDAMVIALADVLAKYYPIDRVALGLDPVEPLDLEKKDATSSEQ